MFRLHDVEGILGGVPAVNDHRQILFLCQPQLTAKEIMELVRRSGDRFECPDNIFGYGIPRLWKAYQNANR